MDSIAESALIVAVPQAESLVERFRMQYDPSAAAGVPAHVTVLYPFKPPHELNAEVIQSLQELFSGLQPFSAVLGETRRFPSVLYLAPEPDEEFRMLTRLVFERFPDTPPYGGQFAEVIPHLTVADVADAQQLEPIAADFAGPAKTGLPIHFRVSEITLIENSSGVWRIREHIALGTKSASG